MLKNINGININYALDGSRDSPVITFVHGQAFNLQSWLRQIDEFQNNFCILRIDLRGHGLTGIGDFGGHLRMTHMAEDIVAVWDHLNIRKSHYVGKSLGGMIGFELALNNNDRLHSLTLVATQGKMPLGSLDQMRRKIEIYKNSPLKMKLAADQLLDRYLTKSCQQNDPGGYELLRKGIIGMSIDAYAFSSEAINAMDYDGYLGDINVPTMIIAGELDIPTPPLRMKMYLEQIRGAQWQVIKGGAHLPNFEKPKEFNLSLSKFLRGV